MVERLLDGRLGRSALVRAAWAAWLRVRNERRGGVAFLEAARAARCGVLVCCGSGSGRAPTLYAAWLVARGGITLPHAVDTLRSRRPLVAPTPRQMAALESWASELAARPT